jgi:hypothetical protein
LFFRHPDKSMYRIYSGRHVLGWSFKKISCTDNE